MYAHVNIWHLSERGRSTDDTAAREIGSQLAQRSGFRSYTVVRTAENEVVVVTIFDTRDDLEAGINSIAEFARQRLAPLRESAPDRREGDVLYQTVA